MLADDTARNLNNNCPTPFYINENHQLNQLNLYGDNVEVNVFTLKLLLLNHNISVPKPNNTAQFTSRMGNLYDSGYEMS